MRSAVSFTLVTSLLLQALPAQAQVARLYAPQISNWSRVRTISAGAPINAAYVGRRRGHQYFVSATDETITVLTPDSLPKSARKTLIEIADTQPGFFTTTKWVEMRNGAVRVTPDGIWVKNHRIAGLEDAVTTVDRGDVSEVSQEIFVQRVRARPPVGPDPDAAAAGAAGVAGGLLTLAACKESCPNLVYLAGFLAPIAVVTVLLARHRDREMELVYRAP